MRCGKKWDLDRWGLSEDGGDLRTNDFAAIRERQRDVLAFSAVPLVQRTADSNAQRASVLPRCNGPTSHARRSAFQLHVPIFTNTQHDAVGAQHKRKKIGH